MRRHSDSIDKKILKRIQSHGKGWVFTPSHFDDLAGSSTITTTLKRHTDAGTIRNLARGLYDYPKMDSQLGQLLPNSDDIAKALVSRDEIRLQPSGAYAANRLGLTAQVPMKVVYLTDGRSRTVQLGNRQIILKQTTPKNMKTAGKISGLVIQALKYLGKDEVDDKVIGTLEERLDDAARKQLMKDIRSAPAWVADIFRRLAKQGNTAK
jgi:hypothetical protein|tara:strand:- start:137 stop:763 length:627 start_codon:yes stop_codon:yes gene_type:complete